MLEKLLEPMPVSLLIIDDDEDDRELFCEAALELDKDLKCTSCGGGEEALKLLRSSKNVKPDFIFLDMNMPRMSGKQCLSKLKESKSCRDIPVIIYSTAKIDRDVAEVKRLGAAAFLIKPSRQKDLMHSIQMVIDQKWENVESTVRLPM